MTNLTITLLKIIMNKIVYFSLLGLFYFAVLVFVSGCKNENQPEKTQEQPQPVEKQETSKKEEKTTGINKRDRLGRTKLHIAAKYAKNLEAVTTLIQAGRREC